MSWIVGRHIWVQNDVYFKVAIANNLDVFHVYQLHYRSDAQLALLMYRLMVRMSRKLSDRLLVRRNVLDR